MTLHYYTSRVSGAKLVYTGNVHGGGYTAFYGYTEKELASVLRHTYGMHFSRLKNGGSINY